MRIVRMNATNARVKVIRLALLSSIVAVLLGLCWWRLAVLHQYVSAPLDAQGRCAKALVPYGWKIDTQASHLPAGFLGKGERMTVVFESQETMLSRWLRWIGRQPAYSPSRLYLDIGRKLELLGFDSDAPADGKEVIGGGFLAPTYLSYRVVKAGQEPIYGVAALATEDKRTFESTHSTINSFRIE